MPPEGDNTRERLLRATLQVIAENGVTEVTNRRVAGAAGVSLGSLTYHFASNTEMLRESLILYVREQAEVLSQLAAAFEAGQVDIEQATAGVEAFVNEDIESRIAKLELYLRAARDDELGEAATRCFEAYDELAASALRTLGVADPERLAPAVVALIDGMQLRRFATGKPAAGVGDVLLMLARAAQAGA